jgi:hypothetical protein
VKITDSPFSVDSLSRVDIFVLRVEARLAAANSVDAAAPPAASGVKRGGWHTVATPNATINLLAYQNGATLTVGTTDVPAGNYRGIRLIIDPSRSSLTLKTGEVLNGDTKPNVDFPGGFTAGLKVVLAKPIAIAPNDTTSVVVDFDVANSFVLRGKSLAEHGLLFKPAIKAEQQKHERQEHEKHE